MVTAELVTLKHVDSNDCGLNGAVIIRYVTLSLMIAATPPWLDVSVFLEGRGLSMML